ncbi:hypothetical protein [Rhizobium sp. Leaf341]|uniref:hypothetical protein n=1 Tax=Rhizobium sp. Leaf341 TaxID=1736344 RepID=UPI000713E25B|nr:hypothetical protein [Rhizobium sp. Leaf341]KQR69229.1 hypothetical protein ASG03_08545 [Rhizobium sp. Leaf341]
MRMLALIAACGCVSGVSVAAPSFLDGAYGDAEGCAYALTSESSGADVFFLLNDEGITTATAYCQFEGTAKKTPSGFSVRTQCDAEGEVGPKETVALDRGAKGYTIRFKDGTTWGPLSQCRR